MARELKQVLWGTLASALLTIGIVYWLKSAPESFHAWAIEDGPIENLSAIMFGAASICFLIFMGRSEFLKNKGTTWAYVMTLGWAILAFVCLGEEISWGQRLFGFDTPEIMKTERWGQIGAPLQNIQNETNIHNLSFVEGNIKNWRITLAIQLLTSVVFPLFVLFRFGRRFCQYIAFPVSPICYWGFAVGGYVLDKYFKSEAFVANDVAETREAFLALAIFCFAVHGALRPHDLFRLGKHKEKNHKILTPHAEEPPLSAS